MNVTSTELQISLSLSLSVCVCVVLVCADGLRARDTAEEQGSGVRLVVHDSGRYPDHL